MTNKYQEALDFVRDRLEDLSGNDRERYLLPSSSLRTLQELVDKNEYKAPVQIAHVYGTIIECPVCHQPITSLGKYCANCGQRIKP